MFSVFDLQPWFKTLKLSTPFPCEGSRQEDLLFLKLTGPWDWDNHRMIFGQVKNIFLFLFLFLDRDKQHILFPIYSPPIFFLYKHIKFFFLNFTASGVGFTPSWSVGKKMLRNTHIAFIFLLSSLFPLITPHLLPHQHPNPEDVVLQVQRYINYILYISCKIIPKILFSQHYH